MYKRTETRPIMVRDVQIGGQNKVVIQSMCNTKTKNVEDTVKLILALENISDIFVTFDVSHPDKSKLNGVKLDPNL